MQLYVHYISVIQSHIGRKVQLSEIQLPAFTCLSCHYGEAIIFFGLTRLLVPKAVLYLLLCVRMASLLISLALWIFAVTSLDF